MAELIQQLANGATKGSYYALIALGYQRFQGYLYGRPVPIADFTVV